GCHRGGQIVKWLEDGAVVCRRIRITNAIQVTGVRAEEVLQGRLQTVVFKRSARVGAGAVVLTAAIGLNANRKAIGRPNDGTARVGRLGVGLVSVLDVIGAGHVFAL